MTDDITFVGLDVSKDAIAVGVAPGSRREAAHYFGTIAHSPAALSKLCKKLSREGSDLHFCYEAGPFGYFLYRRLRGWGHACDGPGAGGSRLGHRPHGRAEDGISAAIIGCPFEWAAAVAANRGTPGTWLWAG